MFSRVVSLEYHSFRSGSQENKEEEPLKRFFVEAHSRGISFHTPFHIKSLLGSKEPLTVQGLLRRHFFFLILKMSEL